MAYKKQNKPNLRCYNQYNSLVNVYNSAIDPKSTITSFKKVRLNLILLIKLDKAAAENYKCSIY
jgi:hypothetical protein